MRRLVSVGLICAIIFLPGTLFSFVKNGVSSLFGGINKTNYTVLICGYDEAAYNTDSIVLVNYDSEINAVSFVQIPRDTYFDFSDGQNKINQYVPDRMANGASLSDAMSDFKSEISTLLGIKIDAYAGYTMRALANIVDLFGGIDVDLPVPVSGVDLDGNKIELKSGHNHLSGAESVVFLRYRSGYLLGDLARIDAQKIFISAFARKLKTDTNVRKIAKILFGSNEGVVTDVNTIGIISFSLKNFKKIKSSGVSFSDMPGEHLLSSDNVSYFCINKHASSELIVHLPFRKISDFDPNGGFINKREEAFLDSYNKTGLDYKIYKEDDLKKLKFITE